MGVAIPPNYPVDKRSLDLLVLWLAGGGVGLAVGEYVSETGGLVVAVVVTATMLVVAAVRAPQRGWRHRCRSRLVQDGKRLSLRTH